MKKGVTVTWKVFSLKYAMTMEGACAVLGLRGPGVTPAALVPTHSLFAKPASVQPLDPIQHLATQ